MPPPAKAALDPESARKRAETMQSYQDYAASRPTTTMTHDEQVADFARRHHAAKSKRIIALAKARGAQMAADRAAGKEEAPAGSYFKDKALSEAGSLAHVGQGVRDVSQTVLEKTDSSAVKYGGMAAKLALGGDVRGVVQNSAVLGDLAGQTMISQDAKIKSGMDSSIERNEASSDALASKVTDLQSAAKGTPERKKAALAAFQAAGTRARDQAELGAYQDLRMKTGPEEYSKEEVLGKAAPASLDYSEGDVVKKDDVLQGSRYGKAKRTLLTGGVSTSGKLSKEQKAEVAKLQKELDDEKDARKAEHEGRDAGSIKGQAKRFVMMQGSKLTDAEKSDIEDIQSRKADHEKASKATEAKLKADKDAVRLKVEALQRSQKFTFPTADGRAKHAELQKQIDALQPSLDEGRKKLADHRAAAKAGSDEFDGQVSDIHARANGGFTRAETAARKAKENQITDIRTGATAAEDFTSDHDGKAINHYNRVGGMIDRMSDPEKMKATTSGTIADYANAGFEHVSDLGKMVGGSADDARSLQKQGKYVKSGITAGVGVGVETAKLAGAVLPGAGHLGDGTQAAISGTLKGVGAIGETLTADAATEERERTHARDVVEGRRREQLKTSSFITTRQPDQKAPTVLGGLGHLAKAVLSAEDTHKAIGEGLGVKPDADVPNGDGGGDGHGPVLPEDGHGPVVPEDGHGPVVPEDGHGPVVPEDGHGAEGGEDPSLLDTIKSKANPHALLNMALPHVGSAVAAGASFAVDKAVEKGNTALAGPVAAIKPDAPVKPEAAAPAPAEKLPWWKRLWRAVKRGASAVGRGVKSVGRAIGRGFKRAGSWVRGLFGSPSH